MGSKCVASEAGRAGQVPTGNSVCESGISKAPSNSSGNNKSVNSNNSHTPGTKDDIEIMNQLTSSLIPSNSISVSKAKHRNQHHERVRNNTTDKHLDTKWNHQLLCFGWVRQSFAELAMDIDLDAIPHKLLQLCFEYIYVEHILFCVIAVKDDSLSSIQALDVNNIYKTHYISKDINIGYDVNGLCSYSSPIKFPTGIKEKYITRAHGDFYHAFFKVGSEDSRRSKALMITKHPQTPPNGLDSHFMKSITLNLPDLPNDNSRFGNTVSYSGQHGLISIGGCHPETGAFFGSGSYSGVLQLDWNLKEYADINCITQCKWKHLRRLNTGRAHACSSFFRDDDGVEKLFVCGGDLNGSVEVYNFADNKWIDVANTNVSRECAGIYYDEMDNLIYLGGGHGAQRKVECYDLLQNEWSIFPNTKCKHDFYPSLFKSSCHYDILYIVSPKSNLCEYIDKREGKWTNAKWNILYDRELHDKLFKVPEEVDFDQFRFI